MQYLRRNLGYLEHMLLFYDETDNPLNPTQHRQLLAISELCRQPKEMYDEKKHSIADRIVSIYQPWVRPILRGKDKHRTVPASAGRFGAKINVSVIDGFSYINQLRWDANNKANI